MDTRRIIALGFFDGVHIGHGALLEKTAQRAKELGCQSSALSFHPHPSKLLLPSGVPLLNTEAERAYLMQSLYGIEQMLLVPFDREMMHMPWQEFFSEILLKRFGAVHLICGEDFTFGRDGEGTAALLASACKEHGIGCDVIEKVALDGTIVSSTHIRSLLQSGDVEEANRFLGHAHFISGTVVHGQHLGRRLGFATANLPLAADIAKPPRGVYCARVQMPDGQILPAVCNLGIHPTAGSLPVPVLEAHILDFEQDLYDQTLRVWLYKMLRAEQRFGSLESLCAQIARDRDTARAYFA